MQQAGEPIPKKKKFVLCCEICEEHFTSHCPLLHGPKSAGTFCGLAGDGLGFLHIPYTSAAKAFTPQKISATAQITIVEGSVPADLVKKELARAIPVKWDWVVREHGTNSYIVPFPCQVELQRMISMKRLRTDNNEGVMLFEEWNNEIKPKQRLQKVWVNVYGVPHEIRSFLPLWAVGTILGATQRVDMRSMKKTGVVRLLVAVLDANCIPDDADIVVGNCLYEIFFKVEQVLTDNNDDNVHPDEFEDDDDLDSKDADKNHEMEDAEKNKNDTGSGSSSKVNPSSLPNSNQPQKNGKSDLEVEKVEKRIDLPVDMLLGEASDIVMSQIKEAAQINSSFLIEEDSVDVNASQDVTRTEGFKINNQVQLEANAAIHVSGQQQKTLQPRWSWAWQRSL
ncbi:hypothetical protein BS78_10G109100 [Paspalum vaginatum]|nr:hypothetical protein BS78_10G109100 [Paspalum vaginatum]